MKWNKKGHEFDLPGNRFADVKKIYIWGAGNNGKALAGLFVRHNIRFTFLDMNPEAGCVKVNGKECDVVSVKSGLQEPNKDSALLLVALKESSIDSALLCAMNSGWHMGENLFEADVFVRRWLSIFLLYNHDYLYLDYKKVITLSFNEKCTLRCKNCNASIPYIEAIEHPVDQVINDSDLVFAKIDYIEILRIGGAETLLYKDIDKVISHIHKQYDKQYGSMELTTNGTVKVSGELIELLTECRVRICISDYSIRFPNIRKNHNEFIGQLKDAGTMYSYMTDMEWVDFGFNNTEEKFVGDIVVWHDSCAHPCKDFRNGKLYSCSQAYWAQRRYPRYYSDADILELDDETIDKKVIYEYLCGYCDNGYLLPCRICNGHTNLNNHFVGVAEQL